MQNLLNNLVALLEQDDRLVVEGRLLKNKIVELALAMDVGLIRRLMNSRDIRHHFFADVDGILVFDKIRLQQFVSNKAFLPDSYTAFKNKIGLMTGEQYLTDSKEVVLVWPYKDCILEGGQTKEDSKRDEVFWNETLAPDQIDRLLAPKALTNFKKYDMLGDGKITNISQDDNLIVKGNNLLALHTLKTFYAGRIKMIYIDPPYNTGNDSFKYNDRFSHSTWLIFMKNRFEVARKFLKEDGTIFVQCDDIELAYLKVLMDEIFGSENFIVTICIETSSINGLRTNNQKPTKVKDYVLMYAKNHSVYSYIPQYQTDYETDQYIYYIDKNAGDVSGWKIQNLEDKILKHFSVSGIDDIPRKKLYQFYFDNRDNIYSSQPVADRLDRIEFAKKEPNKIRIYKNPDDTELIMFKNRILDPYAKKFREIDGQFVPTKLVGDLWTDISYTGIGGEGLVKFKSGKKPEKLLKRIIEMSTKQGDIIMDYHLGSGTTAAVAHKLKRQYVGIEQLDYGENDSIERLKNVLSNDKTGISKLIKWQGGGSYVYCELAPANQNFLDKIQSAETSEELQIIWADMQEKAFLSYRIDAKAVKLSSPGFNALNLHEQKCFLIEVLDKNMLYVPFSEMEDQTFGISDEEKIVNYQFQARA